LNPKMKILVAIANYGTKNLKYLQVLLDEYRRMPFQVDIVILSNEPKDLGPNLEVIVGLPAKNPWSLPFGHKRLFAQRVKDYDLFIYSEDDTPLTENNIRAFLDSVGILPDNEIPGFLRYEVGADGQKHISSAHGRFHWLPESARQVAGNTFAQFTNAHSACYIITRSQLERAIASGGFLVEPYEAEYDMLCSAATDPYTRCGFTKVINISRMEDFLLPHLPNKYVGVMGTKFDVFQTHLDALKQIAAGRRPAVTALPNSRPPLTPPWLKSYYEPLSGELLSVVPKHARSILTVGMGTGATECELVKRGHKVTAIPMDSVISAPAEKQGVEVVHSQLDQGPARLAGRHFDCLIIRNALYLHQDPGSMLKAFAPVLAKDGRFLVQEPNFGNLQTRAGRLLRGAGARLRSLRQGGVHPVSPARVRRWLKSAGWSVEQVVHIPDTAPSKRVQALQRLPLALSSTEFIVTAKRSG